MIYTLFFICLIGGGLHFGERSSINYKMIKLCTICYH